MRLRCSVGRARDVLIGVVLLGAGSVLHAQTVASAVPTSIGTTLTRVPLDDLPSSGTVGGLLETTIPELISDRIDGGGLSAGSAARLGARGSPWSQTAFQLGELDLTDAGASGRSLLFLDPSMFESVDVSTALMSIERAAPGVSIRADLVRPTACWGGRVDGLIAPPARTPHPQPAAPIAALRTWGYLAAFVSGPLIRDRLSIAAGAVRNGATRFERSDPTALQSTEHSAFVNALFTLSSETALSAAVVGRVADVPFEGRSWSGQPDARERLSDLVIDSTWISRLPRIEWMAAVGYAHSDAQPKVASVPVLYVDSVRDQPVISALAGSGLHRRWSAVLRAKGTPLTANRWLRGARAGMEFDRASTEEDPTPVSDVAETVEGVPARLWRFAAQPSYPQRHATTAIVYVAESIAIVPRLTLDAGIRAEAVRASVAGGDSIRWRNWYPRTSVRWDLIAQNRLSAFAGVSRYGYRAALENLAYGDPAAPSADVFRWDDRNGNRSQDAGEAGPLISHVGGAPGESRIDPNLRRPYLDELVTGFDVHPFESWTFRLVGLTREERRLIAGVNTGAPASAYTVTSVPDVGPDELDPSDDQLLPVYSRRAETFGADRYVLTNPSGFHTTFAGIEASVRHTGDRLWLMAGATAGRSSGPAIARGFQPLENDRGIPGDLFLDRNAMTFAHGRYFTDRSYTIKTAGTYRFAHGVRLGVVARYQDGQAFSRLVLAPDLSQGAEVVRAYPNGRTRFAYTLTVDGRVQKQFESVRGRLALMLDVFNLLNMSNEVEEAVVTGPTFRQTTAVQPPRALHLGARITF
jgi:hypothetical protein